MGLRTESAGYHRLTDKPEGKSLTSKVPAAGDHATAWATATKSDPKEWVMIEFPRRVSLTRVDVYENVNPGAVYRILV